MMHNQNAAVMQGNEILGREKRLEGVLGHIHSENMAARETIKGLYRDGEIDGKAAGFAVQLSSVLSGIQSFNNLLNISRELCKSYSL